MNKLLTCTFFLRKTLLSEYSDKYPLKTDSETLNFIRFVGGYRRNGSSPFKGIDTLN